MLRRQYCYVDSIPTNVGVLDKSVAILAALAEVGPLSLAGLVEATGLSRPTAAGSAGISPVCWWWVPHRRWQPAMRQRPREPS